MTEQSTALRLADAIDPATIHSLAFCREAAAELRRLEIQRDALLEALKFYENAGSELSRLVAQRDALLDLLKEALDVCIWPGAMITDLHERASAAIKAVGEGK